MFCVFLLGGLVVWLVWLGVGGWEGESMVGGFGGGRCLSLFCRSVSWEEWIWGVEDDVESLRPLCLSGDVDLGRGRPWLSLFLAVSLEEIDLGGSQSLSGLPSLVYLEEVDLGSGSQWLIPLRCVSSEDMDLWSGSQCLSPLRCCFTQRKRVVQASG